MRQLKYNTATQTVRLEFPDEWDPALVSAITLTITDLDGTELLAASSATIYTATTLDEDVAAYLDEITLASGAGALAPGDIILVDGIAGLERRTVQGYDSTNRVATLETILDEAHADGDNVYPCWATSPNIDTSTVTTWTAGLPVTFKWTPTGSGQAFVEQAQVSKYALAVEGLEQRFKAIYRRAWDDFETYGTFSIMREEAERQVRSELMANGLDINRIVDNDIISPVIMARMAFLWTLNGDENKIDEVQKLGGEYSALVSQLIKSPIWADDDQDLIQDDEEVSDHGHIFLKGW